MRRYLGIIAATVVVLGAAVFAYAFLFPSEPSVTIEQGGPATLPFAEDGTPQNTELGGDLTPEQTLTKVTSRLTKISSGPVVPGMAVVTIPAATASSTSGVEVRYLDRKSGNIFSYQMRSGTLTRTSNRTIPGIQTAVWTPNGSHTIVRYLSGPMLSTINSYVLPASGGNGFFLAQDLADVAVSSTTILTLASGVNGSIASTQRLDGSKPAQVFATALSKLRIGFGGKTQYFAFTKPAADLEGYAFMVDASGYFSPVGGPHPGLTALISPSGKLVLLGFTEAGRARMELVNTATREVLSLPIGTIAEKCAWTADELSVYCGVPQNPPSGIAYPDDWYQGTASFSDRLWRINVAGRYVQLVLDISKEAETPIDIQAPTLDQAGSVLVFVNKADGSLWSYTF